MTGSNDLTEFERLIAASPRVQELLEESDFYDATFADWEKGRRFIASAINQDGALLDVGCANGLLLRCLQEWSPHRLEPFGIDVDEGRLARARALFRDRADHFARCDAALFAEGTTRRAGGLASFPARFELMYWNVWDNARFTDSTLRDVLDGLLCLLKPRGRLVLGFYQPSTAQNLNRITELNQYGYVVNGIAKTPADAFGKVIIWFDQSVGSVGRRHDGVVHSRIIRPGEGEAPR